jgi:hypothetical protein
MAFPPNFKICPGMPSGPTDFFFPIADNRFLMMLVLTMKGLSESSYKLNKFGDIQHSCRTHFLVFTLLVSPLSSRT